MCLYTERLLLTELKIVLNFLPFLLPLSFRSALDARAFWCNTCYAYLHCSSLRSQKVKLEKYLVRHKFLTCRMKTKHIERKKHEREGRSWERKIDERMHKASGERGHSKLFFVFIFWASFLCWLFWLDFWLRW